MPIEIELYRPSLIQRFKRAKARYLIALTVLVTAVGSAIFQILN